LRRPDGRIVGARPLDTRFGCAALAAAAAVVVVAWESDVHPEFLQRLPAPPPAPPEADASIKVAPTPAPSAAPVERAAFDVGLGLAGSLAPSSTNGADPAWGGLLIASWLPTPRPVGVRLAAQAGSERQLALSSGDVRWRRVTVALGAQYRITWRDGQWLADVHADAVGSWVSTRGVGFATNRSDSAPEPGAGAGIRLAMRRGMVVPWLDLAGSGSFRRQVVFEAPSMTSAVLPRLETTLALGVSIFIGRR
ncbi:MAG: hypothetical protein QOI66_3673, partial [Myxococcales bacterium]|nr:hypothetical protein [Myxococcales bacterium]